ncbi:MAG TPA: RIP metalloprotease RseP [Bacteroidia bacterium]|nr:RIP metalloprotease RseP [Bacteroidia bacterium]
MIKFTLFFLSLSLLILLHEFGHYITARWFKARVDKFYLFFDFLFPFPNILKFSLFKKKKGDTEYGIGWFPFGGYVDIAGMMGDPDDKLNKAPEPHEFRGKKPWQRLIILAGGILMNFILAIVIYSMVSFAYGEKYLKLKDAKYGLACDSLLLEAGMRDGDKIIAVDGRSVEEENVNRAGAGILLDQIQVIEVDRQGQRVEVPISSEFEKDVLKGDIKGFFSPLFPFVVDSVMPGSPAHKANLQQGDSLVSINGQNLGYFQHFQRHLQLNKSKNIRLGIFRNGIADTIDVKLSSEGKLGIFPKSDTNYLNYTSVEYNFFEAWARGAGRTWGALRDYIKQFRLLFTKEGASKVGGFATIAGIYPSEWDWQSFWNITALLSVILAFMNLLPIPVLDGGYILFVLWEMVTGKKVSDKFMQRALTIGMYIVLGLLIFANGNDIIRAFN